MEAIEQVEQACVCSGSVLSGRLCGSSCLLFVLCARTCLPACLHVVVDLCDCPPLLFPQTSRHCAQVR